MRDAIGGTLVLQLILVFLVLMNGYLAYSVAYTKAFRAKNEIINIIERNEGYPVNDTCSGTNSAGCQIKDYLTGIGYDAVKYSTASCNGGVGTNYGICIVPHPQETTNNSNGNNTYYRVYYTVSTYVVLNIPILENFFPQLAGKLFAITGETNTIYSSGQTNVYLGLESQKNG